MSKRLIKQVSDKYTIEYNSGNFDNWCIYLTRRGGVRYAPLDDEYFTLLLQLGLTHGYDKIYADFVKVYARTSKTLDETILKLIEETAAGYEEDRYEMEIWFTVIYAGMIAEENKMHTKLGKRIKRLGMHQTLIDKIGPGIAAHFSRNKPWRELDAIMQAKGF
ncbi:MAG: hypothetical protein EOP46_01040 [Sphingobacteriaceae bacterium]|nr:MAG: hypothetical protein EOP46_01040 [Sphingobacteriaceae bacterium]